MGDSYRNDEAALRAQVDRLREDVAAAEADASEQARLREELEEALAALKASRLSAAEREQATQDVGRRRMAIGALVGATVLCLAGGGAWLLLEQTEVAHAEVSVPAAAERGAASWFSQARPHCNGVEVKTYPAKHPPPATDAQRFGYLAACQALANHIADARTTLQRAPQAERKRAAAKVFNIIHPVADAGDDIAAGPVMELVLEFSPDNYQAVFHAGMAAYEKKDDKRARIHLERFLAMYAKKDNWRSRATKALAVLDRIARGEDVERPAIPAH